MTLRFLSLAWLLPALTACTLFSGPTSPLSDQCYTDPAAANTEAAQLALGSEAAAYVPGRLLVSYKNPLAADGVSSSKAARTQAKARARAQVRAEYGFKTLESVGDGELVSFPKGVSVPAMLRTLRADPRVRYAEPDRYLYPLSLPQEQIPAAPLPNDPYLQSEQWHLLDFGVPEAWQLETGQAEVVVAILDSGVDLQHEDLVGRALPGCDLYNHDNDPNPGSPSQIGGDQRHGTHVAGIALATGDNAKGVAGVAYSGVRLLPVKVFDDAGSDSERTATSVVANAIRWAAGLSVEGMNRNPYPAKIINLSLGGDSGDQTIKTLDDAVADARKVGSLVIAASGNSGRSDTIFAPANAPGALAVGSVDQTYLRSDFSNFAATGRSVDLMAPGGNGSSSCITIFSTLSPAFEGDTKDEYGCEGGTSMATPFVAGIAALIWSQNPALSDDEVEARLRGSTRFTAAMNRTEYGAGVVCADRALGAATLCGE